MCFSSWRFVLSGEEGSSRSGTVGSSEVDKWELVLNDLDIPVGKLTVAVGQVTIEEDQEDSVQEYPARPV